MLSVDEPITRNDEARCCREITVIRKPFQIQQQNALTWSVQNIDSRDGSRLGHLVRRVENKSISSEIIAVYGASGHALEARGFHLESAM